jgi:hypothetical protein
MAASSVKKQATIKKIAKRGNRNERISASLYRLPIYLTPLAAGVKGAETVTLA